MTTVEILTRAQRLLLDKGWCKFALHNDAGQFCARGAIEEVATRAHWVEHCQAAEAVFHEANHLDEYEGPNIVDFNNAAGTELGDVLQAFDAAIALASQLARGRHQWVTR